MTQYERELTNLQALELIPDAEIRKEVIDLFLRQKEHDPNGLLFENDDYMFAALMNGIAPGCYGMAALTSLINPCEMYGGASRAYDIFLRLNVSPHDSN